MYSIYFSLSLRGNRPPSGGGAVECGCTAGEPHCFTRKPIISRSLEIGERESYTYTYRLGILIHRICIVGKGDIPFP